MQSAVRLSEKIDEAFGGEPFDRRWPPDHRKNIKRFRMFMSIQMETFDLYDRAHKAYLWASRVAPGEWRECIGMQKSTAQEGGENIPPGYHVAMRTPHQVFLQRDESSKRPIAPPSRDGLTSDDVAYCHVGARRRNEQ